MTESKSVAVPLGYAPLKADNISHTGRQLKREKIDTPNKCAAALFSPYSTAIL
jgi:hypothetical protein